ncbi:PAAR domain-containing protein [Aerolutibacter daejeonensis]|uniref:PAAR domain-containing protein n=1 Tax=Aerolutibacter daejeonensis TaxID=346181 RepID=UPI0009FE1822|nr:PAAR domain-containing protein [Lysobacter daejeonensis]
MSKPFIVLGDKTDHGGTVVAVSSQTFIDGKPVARLGDKVVCPQCKGTFPVAAGDPTLIIDGQPVARHGDKTACGATLLSGQARVFVDAGGSSPSSVRGGSGATGSPGLLRTAPTVAPDGEYDEAFVLQSELTGVPLANRRYRIIREGGSIETGVTDDNGRTHVVRTERPERVDVQLEEEAV